jgi:hypothetical protein
VKTGYASAGGVALRSARLGIRGAPGSAETVPWSEPGRTEGSGCFYLLRRDDPASPPTVGRSCAPPPSWEAYMAFKASDFD